MKEELQREMAKGTPYFDHLGIEIVEVSEGYAKLRFDFKDQLAHPFGYFHGGAIASLADATGVNAVMTLLGDDGKIATLEMKINYFVSVKNVALYAEGKVVHKGKRFAVADVDVKSMNDEFIAKAIVTCAIS
ncbi:MAG TPA: PaaI family thioesterase [Syntrophorhabdaceae bacterium]|nr:PaaI family thioesterase [Syntrophorhabdaceae bacterium]HQM80528.1 PaaI family thioesterase [Syntrophorhabdaceae bacterium]